MASSDAHKRAARNYEKNHPDMAKKFRDKTVRRNRDWLYRTKAERGCSRCGESDPRCLDFHHISRDTKYRAVSQLVCAARETLKREIDKCIVLCSNCHRKETFKPYKS